MHVLVVVFSSLHYITDKTDKTDNFFAGFSFFANFIVKII